MKQWISNVTAGFLGGLLASLSLVALLAWQSDRVAQLTIESNPTCEVPTGLSPLPTTAIRSASGQQSAPLYGATKAIDGFGGSIWVPPFETDGKHPVPQFIRGEDTLTLTLDKPHDIRLVCVVNGLANSFINYANWARVRTVTVRGDGADSAQTSVLSSLGTDSFPNSQLAGKALGSTRTVSIQLVNAFAGQTEESFDPDVCFTDGSAAVKRPPGMTRQPRFAQGCIVDPSPKAGLADVFLYEPGP